MKQLSNSTFVTPRRAFQASAAKQKREARCKRRIERRLRRRNRRAQLEPMFRGRNIHSGWNDRVRGLGAGGIGAMHLLVQRLGLAAEIDASLHLLQVHQPYHESDHVLHIAYNILCGGKTLEDLEQLRHDEVYQDAIGARAVPDPTTAGDFTRRFGEPAHAALMAAIDRVRVKVWQQQPAPFFDDAIVEADGTLAPTYGERKEGMEISYHGVWGYHPLVVTLANTGEPLYLGNRSGNRPSHEGAAERFDQAITLCRQAGFRKVLLRGDTDFSSTRHAGGGRAGVPEHPARVGGCRRVRLPAGRVSPAVAGVDAEGVVRTVAARDGSLGGAASGREAEGIAHGVPHVPAVVHRHAVSDRSRGATLYLRNPGP